MPTKMLDSQAGRGGVQKTYKFGGGKNEIRAEDDGGSTFGYIINSGGGDDMIFGSDFSGRWTFDSTADPRTEFGDLLVGGDGSDNIEGGLGNDTIFGGNEDGSDSAKGKDAVVRNILYGEADILDTAGTYDAGNDVLVGGADGSNVMVGDVGIAGGGGIFNGGNDILISGMNADDNMTGDFGSARGATIYGGEDTFVFGVNNGADLITDFRRTDDDGVGETPELIGDKINLTATGLSWDDLAGHININVIGGYTIIDLGQAIDDTAMAGVDQILVSGVIDLVEADFVFDMLIDPGDALV